MKMTAFAFIIGILLGGSSFSAEYRHHLAGYVARIGVGREKDERGSDFFGLTGSLHRRVRAVFGDLFGFFVRNVQRRPDRTR